MNYWRRQKRRQRSTNDLRDAVFFQEAPFEDGSLVLKADSGYFFASLLAYTWPQTTRRPPYAHVRTRLMGLAIANAWAGDYANVCVACSGRR